MVRLAWLNRFLIFLVFVLFFFVMTVGSIIVTENSRSSQQGVFDASASPMINDHVDQVIPFSSSHVHTAEQDKPMPRSASVSVKQLYHRMSNNQQSSSVYLQPTSSSRSSTFDEGYDWALTHRVKQVSQCAHLSDEFYEGCKSFVEVSHYVRQTQSNLNL